MQGLVMQSIDDDDRSGMFELRGLTCYYVAKENVRKSGCPG
jgi:hypothetical protein